MERRILEDSLQKEYNAKIQLNDVLQEYKDEVDTLKEALSIAAASMAEHQTRYRDNSHDGDRFLIEDDDDNDDDDDDDDDVHKGIMRAASERAKEDGGQSPTRMRGDLAASEIDEFVDAMP